MGLARPHRTIQGLHKASVNVTVIRRVHRRWILLMRILRVRRRYVNHSDRELAGLVHEATELSRLVHVAGGRLRHPVAILGHEIRVQRHVRADPTGGALHLGTGTSGVQGLPVETFARVRLCQRRHVRVRRGPRGRSTGRSRRARGDRVVIILGVAEGYLRRCGQLSRSLRRRHGMRDRGRRRQIHRRRGRGWYHLQAVCQLLQFR